MSARDRITLYTTFALVIAFVAIGSYVLGGAGDQWMPSGSSTPYPDQLAAPTVVATSGPQLVMVVTITPEFSPTVKPTTTPYPVPTEVRTCVKGEAIEGQICVQPWPTKPPIVYTPISPWPGDDRATPGVTYMYQPTSER